MVAEAVIKAASDHTVVDSLAVMANLTVATTARSVAVEHSVALVEVTAADAVFHAADVVLHTAAAAVAADSVAVEHSSESYAPASEASLHVWAVKLTASPAEQRNCLAV